MVKRKLFQTSKFYYFDVGFPNYLLQRFHLKPETPECGYAFESLVMQEIRAYLGYTNSEEELTYWLTYNKDEVDAVIGDARISRAIMSTEYVKTKHKIVFRYLWKNSLSPSKSGSLMISLSGV